MKRIAEMADIKPILRKLPRIKKYLLNSDNIRWVPAKKKRGILVKERPWPVNVLFSVNLMVYQGFLKWDVCGKTIEMLIEIPLAYGVVAMVAHFVQFLNGVRNLEQIS